MNGWKDKLDEYVDRIENIMDKKLEEGSDERVKSMRVTVDPVVMLHRPLLWYFIVATVDSMTSLTLLLLGFKHYAPPQWFQSFPPRPVLSLLSRKAPPAALIPYWYKPHRSRTKLPLVFIHGIGIGLYPYIPTLRQLTSEDPDLGILPPELLPISMHMTPRPVPPRPAMLASLDAILESLCAEERASQDDARSPLLSQELPSWSRVVLAAHSYGTFVAGWVVRNHSSGSDSILPTAAMQRSPSASSRTLSSPAPSNMPVALAPSLSTKIAHLVLFDAIPILLSHPPMAHNSVYRHPSSVLHHEPAEASLGALANRESHNDYHAHEHPESSNPPTRSGAVHPQQPGSCGISPVAMRMWHVPWAERSFGLKGGYGERSLGSSWLPGKKIPNDHILVELRGLGMAMEERTPLVEDGMWLLS
ncbi:hypothetical protein BDQ12DRAFT_717235 [Crucibulum laeve]|uniref:AB hydrolase-1 domain-containing protein n=1 Tax=Crucibulum laeve TaxID=68775 RepID=A0A5C3MGL4_9AGAR|nr:hypothetical protein BDQ12DRAFT_717235 [Crucibulum laeve]